MIMLKDRFRYDLQAMTLMFEVCKKGNLYLA